MKMKKNKTKDIIIDNEYITTLHYCEYCMDYMETYVVEIPHDFIDDSPIGKAYKCDCCGKVLEEKLY